MNLKLFFTLFTLTLLLLNSCNKQKEAVPPQTSINNESGANCFTLCHTKLKTLCPNNNIQLDSCLQQCATWTDATIDCMSTATKCDQINIHEGSCRTEDLINPFETEEKKEINYACSKACYNYKTCVSYAEDDTQADRESAYNTCFQECQNWSPKSVQCMSSFRVQSAMDCVRVNRCGFNEYLGR